MFTIFMHEYNAHMHKHTHIGSTCQFNENKILLHILGAVLLTVGRSYVGNDVTHSTLLDRA